MAIHKNEVDLENNRLKIDLKTTIPEFKEDQMVSIEKDKHPQIFDALTKSIIEDLLVTIELALSMQYKGLTGGGPNGAIASFNGQFDPEKHPVLKQNPEQFKDILIRGTNILLGVTIKISSDVHKKTPRMHIGNRRSPDTHDTKIIDQVIAVDTEDERNRRILQGAFKARAQETQEHGMLVKDFPQLIALSVKGAIKQRETEQNPAPNQRF